MLESLDPVFSFLTVGFIVKTLTAYVNQGKRPKNVVSVGRVTKLYFYPVKSMGGISLHSVQCTQKGLKYPHEPVFDRAFLVITENGTLVTSRTEPKLALIRPRIEGHHLMLECDGSSALKLPKVLTRDKTKAVFRTNIWGLDAEGQDCGDEASEWISTFLGKTGYRLIYNMEDLLEIPHTAPYNEPLKIAVNGTKNNKTVFHEKFPHHLLSAPSLKDLNSQQKEPMKTDKFRPSILIDGCKAYEEDTWDEIWIGDVKFTNSRLCESYRRNNPRYATGPMSGVYLLLDSPNGSQISVGDKIYAMQQTEDF